MSKVVFGLSPLSPPSASYIGSLPPPVGNVPYNMGEARFITNQKTPKQPPLLTAVTQDQLIDVFKSVGQVVGFRCVSDRPMRFL